MKTKLTIAVLAFAALVLSACGQQSEQETPSELLGAVGSGMTHAAVS